MYKLRDYQELAGKAACQAFADKKNGIIILPTGAGKSLVIAYIASKLQTPLLILQPSKEILEQNYSKYQDLNLFFDSSLYSASVNRKDITRVTFATIGSVINDINLFNNFKNVLIDECHLVNSSEGMYKKFLTSTKRTIVGLTATPYRLYSNSYGSQLRFITRTRPRIFEKVLYYIQIKELLSRGYLSKLRYFDLTCINMENLKSNSTNSDYTEHSILQEYKQSNFYGKLLATVRRLLSPKSGIPRKGILVFTRFVKEAEELVREIPGFALISANTPKKEREAILKAFKNGNIKGIANAQTLTTGFDYPELDTIVMARPTKSLSLWYQCVGRAIRYYPGKEGWIVDLCGNINRFGRVEDLRIINTGNEKYCIVNNEKQLTNTYL